MSNAAKSSNKVRTEKSLMLFHMKETGHGHTLGVIHSLADSDRQSFITLQ